MTEKKQFNILLGFSGSVASIKAHVIIGELNQRLGDNCNIKAVLTEKAAHFVDQQAVDALSIPAYHDRDEWSSWTKRGDDVLHIELGKWADVFVISPLSANSLAKISNGICDNLLTCVVRAWDLNKPLLFAPAMNTRMLQHPITQPQIETLQSWGYTLIPTVSKTLMCGETGLGAMAEPKTIADQIVETFRTLETE